MGRTQRRPCSVIYFEGLVNVLCLVIFSAGYELKVFPASYNAALEMEEGSDLQVQGSGEPQYWWWCSKQGRWNMNSARELELSYGKYSNTFRPRSTFARHPIIQWVSRPARGCQIDDLQRILSRANFLPSSISFASLTFSLRHRRNFQHEAQKPGDEVWAQRGTLFGCCCRTAP